MKTKTTLAILSLAMAAGVLSAAPITETVTIRTSDGAVLNTVAADFTAGKLKVGGVTISATPAWSSITGKPNTLSGYGITDPVVLTSGTFSNPSWITALAWSKLSNTPTTLEGYGLATKGADVGANYGGAAGGLVLNGGDADDSFSGGNAGSIYMRGSGASGGNPGAPAGVIYTDANGSFSGGSLYLASNGSNTAGSINTQAGGDIISGTGTLLGPDNMGVALIVPDIGSTVQAYSDRLQALAANGAPGVLVQTSSPDGIIGRSIIGTSGEITVSAGNGNAGNPTLSLASSGVTAATYDPRFSYTVDAKGRVTGTQELPWAIAQGEGVQGSSTYISVPTGVGTIFTWWTKAAGSGVTLTSKRTFTFAKTGKYYIQCVVGGAVPTDQVWLFVVRNGTDSFLIQSSYNYRAVAGFGTFDVNATTDTFEIGGVIWSGGPWNASDDYTTSHLIVRWFAPL